MLCFQCREKIFFDSVEMCDDEEKKRDGLMLGKICVRSSEGRLFGDLGLSLVLRWYYSSFLHEFVLGS